MLYKTYRLLSLVLLVLRVSLVIKIYFLLTIPTFVKIASLAAYVILPRQDLECPKYCICLEGKFIIQHVYMCIYILYTHTYYAYTYYIILYNIYIYICKL